MRTMSTGMTFGIYCFKIENGTKVIEAGTHYADGIKLRIGIMVHKGTSHNDKGTLGTF
jgi:hypothetical protein